MSELNTEENVRLFERGFESLTAHLPQKWRYILERAESINWFIKHTSLEVVSSNTAGGGGD